MALQSNIYYIPNQPQKVDTPEAACDVSSFEYKNIVNADDITKFQFQLYTRPNTVYLNNTPELDQDIGTSVTGVLGCAGGSGCVKWTTTTVTSSGNDFEWTSLLGGFIYDNNTNYASLQQLNSDNNYTYASGTMLEAKVYFQTNVYGCTVYVGNEQFIVAAGVTGEQTFYTVVSNGSTATIGILFIPPTVGTARLVVNYFRVKEVSLDYIFFLRNLTTDAVEYAYNLRDYINETYPNGTGPFRRVDNFVTYEHDWTGQAEGCYRIEIADQRLNTNTQNNVFNNKFLVNDLSYTTPYDSVNWVASASGMIAQIINSQLVLTTVAANGAYAFYTSSTLENGKTYNISLDAATGSGGGTYTFSYGNQYAATSIVLANGADHTDTIVGNGDQLIIGFALTSGAMTLKFNSISVTLQDENNLVGNYYSNDFVLTNSACESIEISACNDNDSFDFSFPLSNFSLNTRLLGKATNPKYDFDRFAFVNNEGNTRTTYFRRQKIKNIKLDLVPEYMLDFLTLLGGMDHIYIDGVEYVADKDEFIAINYDGALDNFAKVQLFLFEKDTTAQNKATTALGIGCGADVEYVLDPEDITDPNDDTQIIDPQSGDPLISLQ